MLIQRQRIYFQELAQGDAARPAAIGGCENLDYLVNNWMPVTMWRSRSEWGRLAAATVMKVPIPIEGVVPTTNHLESFNAILKWKHLTTWLHSGHCLHFDSLIHILITWILPRIYGRQKTHQEYLDWLNLHFKDQAGGRNLTELYQQFKDSTKQHAQNLAWWEPDVGWDHKAQTIVQLRQLTISRGKDSNTYEATCSSSKGNILDPSHSRYHLYISYLGLSSCNCPDFSAHGGACKHLRALHICIKSWINLGQEHAFKYPTSYDEACQLQCHQDSLQTTSLHPPMLATMEMPIRNWTILQSLANDPTTIDDMEDKSSTVENLELMLSAESDDEYEPDTTNLLVSVQCTFLS